MNPTCVVNDSISLISCEEIKIVVLVSLAQHPIDHLVAHERIETRERLVEDQHRRPERQRSGQDRLHAHAVRQLPESAVGRQIEVAPQRALEVGIPAAIERAQVVEILRDREPLRQRLILRYIADPSEVLPRELPRVDAEHPRRTRVGLEDIYEHPERGRACPHRSSQPERMRSPAGRAARGRVRLDAGRNVLLSSFAVNGHRRLPSMPQCFSSSLRWPEARRRASRRRAALRRPAVFTSSFSSRCRSPARAFGCWATAVPIPGRTSSQRS